jgi:hypothetical protein
MIILLFLYNIIKICTKIILKIYKKVKNKDIVKYQLTNYFNLAIILGIGITIRKSKRVYSAFE